MDEPLPRYAATRRRDFLRRTALLGTVGLVPALVACGDDDAELRASTPSEEVAASTSPAPTTTNASTTAPTAMDDDASNGGEASGAGQGLPAEARVEVAFTYAAAGGGGPVRNPYVVAWVEDPSGALVRNLSLWYNPPKGNRWIGELSSWYAADEAYFAANGSDDLEAVTGASRPAGSYTVEWDGSTESGGRAVVGTYRILVESAREHGPHSLISVEIELGDDETTAQLSSDGELVGGTVTYRT